MVSVELKWKTGLTSWVGGIERLLRRNSKGWFGTGKAATPTRKEPETEGERALYEAMGWEYAAGDEVDGRDYTS